VLASSGHGCLLLYNVQEEFIEWRQEFDFCITIFTITDLEDIVLLSDSEGYLVQYDIRNLMYANFGNEHLWEEVHKANINSMVCSKDGKYA
jgi:hypothetical protein